MFYKFGEDALDVLRYTQNYVIPMSELAYINFASGSAKHQHFSLHPV